uniref:alkyl hydroperoxide reductase subunit F n=1 Tax=Prevotella sp. TaxID=59823 RepID=UPI003FEF0403
MLDRDILEQVKTLLAGLKSHYVLRAALSPGHQKAGELEGFLTDFCSCSPMLELQTEAADGGRLEFAIVKDGAPTGITFRGIPGGHEFTSLLLALLNADGAGKNLPDGAVAARIRALKGPVRLRTYMSLSCTNCPDVVQALNVVTLLGTDVEHEIVDGGLWQDEVAALGIQGVPSVFADGELLHVGRGDLGVLLDELEAKYGSEGAGQAEPVERRFDVVVVGGGPAGASAAIYSARKGLSVAVVAGRIGGQVNDTVGIENLISVPATTGASLAAALQEHIGAYPIEVFANRSVEGADFSQPLKSVKAKGGETFVAPAVIIATGASWRRLGVEGESEYIGRGVAFCPHCDGPFYKGRHVAVIGGGNSGIEAAIDLAGICSRVTVLEFAAELRADTVLQDKARSLGNVEILTSRQTVRVVGDGKKVTAIDVRDLNTGEVSTLPLDGVFVQIGLVPASGPFAGLVDINRRGEIVTDGAGRSSVPGVYAAGDVADVPFKQIVIAMGDGATAALSAFDDRVRGVLGS